MGIRIVAQGGIDVRGVTVNGGEQQVAKNGNQVEVNATANDSVLVKVDRNGEGNVEIPPLNDYDRQRGWRRLNTSHGGVIAYGLDEDKVILLPKADPNSWMSILPDSRAIADLTIPGTHESASLSGGFVSQCQTTDVNEQLRDGIRFLDIRIRLVNGELQTYHGIQPQHSTLNQQVEWIEQFLRENPRETVICSIKQENDLYPDFPPKVYEVLTKSGLWSFDENLPVLGQVRGRAILLSRFDRSGDGQFPNGLGLKPSHWSDNQPAGFDANNGDNAYRIHDWYNTGDIAAKAGAIEQHLEPTLQPRGDGTGPNHPLTIDFTSGGTFPAAPPQWFASGGDSGGMSKLIGGAATLLGNLTGTSGGNANSGPQGGVNSRLVKWLLANAIEGRRPRAAIVLDFYRDTGGGHAGVAELLSALNLINNQ